jgi:hypothetical protein
MYMKKITHEKFVKQIKEILPEIKILGEYTLSKNKILVQDNFGIKYNVFPSSLLKGCYPTIKTSVNVIDYLTIVLKEKNNLIYLSGYTSYKGKIFVKDSDEIIYHCSCQDLLRGDFSVPSLKSAVNKNDGFIKKSNKVHNNFYDYSLLNYCDTRKLIDIICPVHGIFQQQPVNHLRGCGCPKCGLENTINNLTTNHIGWSLNKWKSVGNKHNGVPKVYVVKVFGNDETFIKIGRTYKSIEDRLSFLKLMNYTFEIIKVIDGDYEFVYNKEKELLRDFKKFKHSPKVKFNGYQECFDKDIINIFNED